MKKILLAFITFLSLAAVAQDNAGDAVTEKRTIMGSFNAISVSDGIDLYLTQGNEDSLTIGVSDKKYLARFRTDVINGTLKIYYESKGITWVSGEKGKLKAYLSFKMAEKLSATSGATVNAKVSLNFENLAMSVTSGAVFNGALNVKMLSIEQSSGSVMNISGKAEKIKLVSSSGAIFKGYDMAVDNCDGKVSSGAMMQVTINKELTARASSGGGIHYKGEGLIRDVSTSSGGVVKRDKG